MRDPAADLALPRGFRDILPTEARELHAIERTLMAAFASYGYVPLEPPTVELAAGLGDLDEHRLLRFLDRDGRLLALRPDLTTAIARVVAQRYRGEKRAIRLAYVTPVFREEASMRGSEREYDQAGVELIGDGSARADAEVIALLASALEACGLAQVELDVGHAGVLAGWLEGLAGDARERALACARTGDLVGALRAARDGGLASDRARELERALRYRGDDLSAPREHAPPAARAALDALAALRPLLDAAGVHASVRFDLGYVPSLAYYSGVVFQAVAPGLGAALASGGRYDGLLARYGADRPATGFGIAVPHLHQAVVASGWRGPDESPLVVLEPSRDDAATLRAAAALRAQGRAVVIGEPADTAGRKTVAERVR